MLQSTTFCVLNYDKLQMVWSQGVFDVQCTDLLVLNREIRIDDING